MMEHQDNQNRLSKIERKLNLLITLSIVQASLMGLIVLGMILSKLLSSVWPMVVTLLVVVVFLFLFRRQIPGWAGRLSRFVFAKMSAAQKSNSMKDIR